MIGIILSNNLNTCPYVDKYLYVFNKRGISYELVLWDRDGSQKKFPANYRVFDVQSNVDVPKWKKIFGFCRFARFVYNTIKIRKYEKLIFLTTQTAVMCYFLTQKKFKRKYIFDFRDLSFEQNSLYRKLVKKIIDNSYFTCMSSPEFAKVYGIDSYFMAHNFRYKDLANSTSVNSVIRQKTSKITLLHIGISRGEQYNNRLVEIFGNDERFEICIVGRGSDTDSFVQIASRYSNITVKGTYNNEEKESFINKADMLLYYYPCDFNCNRALANKYYDCLIYKKPLVGNINTYSGGRLKDKGLGISINFDSNTCADEIYDYYVNLDYDNFINNITSELNAVLEEDKIYLNKIQEFADQ